MPNCRHINDINFMAEIQCLKFMNHFNMTGSITQLNKPRAQRFLLKKCNFCTSAFSETKSNRRGDVRADKYCTTQMLWEPGRHQCSRNKLHLKILQHYHTRTPLTLHSEATARSSTGLWCAMWENQCFLSNHASTKAKLPNGLSVTNHL